MSKKRNTTKITTPAILKAHTFMYPEGTLDISKRLMEAVERNDFEAAETLLACGANVNTTDTSLTDTRTPLCLAVENNNKKMATLLLENGANPNYRANYTHPAIVNAIKIKSYELIKLLLAYGAKADWDYTDPSIGFGMRGSEHDIDSALDYDVEIVKLLLSAGAKLRTGHFTPIYKALSRDIQVTKFLYDLDELENLGNFKNSVLCAAIRSDGLEIVKLLLCAGANPNGLSLLPLTLKIAVDRGYIEITKELLKAGAIINIWRSINNPQISVLLKAGKISDKIEEGHSLDTEEKAFILDESLSDEVKATFLERAGKLLAFRASNQAWFKGDFSWYSELSCITQIINIYNQQLAKFAVDKIAAGHSLLPAEKIGLLEIKTNPIYKEVQKEFTANLCEKIAKNYKKFGETLSAEKYSDILRAELVREVNNCDEIQKLKNEVLSYFVDIISNLFGYEHIPPAEALDEGADISAKYEILRTQLIEAYKPEESDKILLTNKIFAIIQKAIENPVKSLCELFAIDRDGIGASIDDFLKEPSMGVIFDERQANIYRSLYEMNDKGIISNRAVKHLIAEHFSHFFRGYDVTIEAESFEESHAAIDTPAAGGAGASVVDAEDESMSDGFSHVIGDSAIAAPALAELI